MKSRLTLSIDPQIILNAKAYASREGRSLSELIETYFKNLTIGDSRGEKEEISHSVRSLMGSFKTTKGFGFNYKRILQEQKTKKHG